MTSVVFIHGLWIHSSSWQPWQDLFTANGYQTHAPGWPGDASTVAATRAAPDALNGIGVDEITGFYADLIAALPERPIVIGHSFGGLIAQKLLAAGLAEAAVAISPAPVKGIRALPFSQLRSSFPVLSNPGNKARTVSLTPKQFGYAFGNTLSPAESTALFDRWTIPGPGLPLFQAATANFTRDAPTAVDTTHTDRGPLLLIAAGQDHTVPASVVTAAHRLYRNAELRTYADRGHSAPFDHGWREIADDTLIWLNR
ncbi:alpha/beta hydrolase [Actinoplanes derwentensis]|uniref:Lysophospholipase, alpha-beta hydrolase superfamily n=1 Tax=Actinoplanes derwentensis TaxID=113562 RepID=A0A1H2B8X3_9ACTN|nr:alpha/beta hydrolase [Actinoplanes derwentensis]GID86465.1 alpha/beta hydrolase [Actinoplanes derwentensis]SDT54681.1 Lysophospholipase, alpha-beta hydrolase superfamily [Actinoplanes derwentensis]